MKLQLENEININLTHLHLMHKATSLKNFIIYPTMLIDTFINYKK